MESPVTGILPILHTPLDDRDEIQWDSLQREIDWAFQLGVQGVCSAMVSEVLRLTSTERNELNRQIVEITQGRGVVVASVGAESTKAAVEFADSAVESGCTAIMAIPPISTALPREALWSYFSTLARSFPVPLIVQDASSYVGASIPTQFYVDLLDEFGEDKILFKPEGAPVGPNISDLRDASGRRARMFDGSGGNLLVDAFRRGVIGTMPGMDMLDAITAIWNALQSNDFSRAYEIYYPVCAMVALQLQAGLDGFLAIEKHVMVRRGIFSSTNRRAPYAWSLDDETRAEVDRILDHLDGIVNQHAC